MHLISLGAGTPSTPLLIPLPTTHTLAPEPLLSGPGPVTHLGLSHPTPSHPMLNSSSREKPLLDINVVTTEVNRTKISVRDRSENNLKLKHVIRFLRETQSVL